MFSAKTSKVILPINNACVKDPVLVVISQGICSAECTRSACLDRPIMCEHHGESAGYSVQGVVSPYRK